MSITVAAYNESAHSSMLWITDASRYFTSGKTVDWHTRFSRETEQFQPGEIVALFASVTEPSPNTFVFTAGYNPTMADTFTIAAEQNDKEGEESRPGDSAKPCDQRQPTQPPGKSPP
jgi:hypothetical protein